MMSGSTHHRPSNEIKFETGNPVVQRMIGGFFDHLRELIGPLEPARVLDAGSTDRGRRY